MRDLAILFIHLLSTIARLMRPGGARAVVAESLLVKHQLVILNWGSERAPNLRPMDRVIAGLCTLFIRPYRLLRVAVVFRPSTLLAFHAALVRRKYRILDVTEVKTVPYLPISHPFVERLIGTIRREYLDLVPFRTARDIENKLLSFKVFYNDKRCHYALDGDTPSERTGMLRPKVANLDSYRWQSYCRGIYHLPVAT
ncbi:protein of unknown function [uncultured Woeseiaceae bacterium]|uniref:Integrase catalytic domain-containing protein n=1 Tax=uncultured Woeseiaceae bacterium TaxID=1983305 RepID=A0A7D9H7V0_9GAMM|nr:protein of unknown function [uncultured Woeseiaceae bacterium]